MRDRKAAQIPADTDPCGALSLPPTATTHLPSLRQREGLGRILAGTLLARPWFDHATHQLLRHIFFPASRLFAAAGISHGDVDRFVAAVPIRPDLARKPSLARALAVTDKALAAARAIDVEWDRVMFGHEDAELNDRVAVEAARLDLRHAYNTQRWRLRLVAPWRVPRARLAIETPASVAAVYGEDRAAFERMTLPPETIPAIDVSRRLSLAHRTDYWLRFPSPSGRVGDVVHARVHEPLGAKDPPTILLGHGICVDFDHWKGLIDECSALVQRGFRVIRPEAPWHGRRTPAGYFSGERAVSAFPMGLLDSMCAALQEWSVLAHWARTQSQGPLFFGGSSLGAMTAQLAASRSVDWPEALRPNGLFLVTHTGDMTSVVLDGALSNLWATPQDAAAKGWTPELARRFLSLLDPLGPLPVPAAHVVSILGKRDTVLPFASGRDLVERWGVPGSNLFIWDRGHFSVPATLIRRTEPLERLAAVARALS